MIEWKDIIGYEGLYKISNTGIVFTIRKGIALSPNIVASGYLAVGLSKNGVSSKKRIHRLVAEYFVENPLNLPEVNHKDGDKTNNNYWNLEWSTHANNLDHAHKNELKGKLKHNEVLDIFNSSKSPKELSASYNISVSNISLIRSGKAWSFLTKNSKQ